MGNTGSAHNLHSEGVNSELNSYYAQQYIRRTTIEAKKKYNQVVLGGWSSGRNVTECKVLPKPTENLKLRATTNGAILQAGGTISFRAKDQLEERSGLSVLDSNSESTNFKPMRRCHTLILDSQNDLISQRKSVPLPTEFRRSKTLLHVGYIRSKSQENSSVSINEHKNRLSQPSPITASSTFKINKYNKKRKAPLAPTKNTTNVDITNNCQTLTTESKTTCQTKPRMYATNSSNKPSAPYQSQQLSQRKCSSSLIPPFQRGGHTRASANFSRPVQPNNCYGSKLPYRREKSFDAVLLRQKDNDCHERGSAQKPNIIITDKEQTTVSGVKKIENSTQRNIADGSRKKKLTRLPVNSTANTIFNSFNNIYNCAVTENKSGKRIGQQNSNEVILSSKPEAQTSKLESKGLQENSDHDTIVTHKKIKSHQSRIPQLKRTFYFGMESLNKVTSTDTPQSQSNVVKSQCRNDEKGEENDDMVLINRNVQAEEEIVDNGILVHVRPTLPRRQPETPSFSPAAAWRNLLEEQQRLQHERSKKKSTVVNNRIIESPICLTLSPKETTTSTDNWTPQQDLEDEDDEEDDDVNQKCKTTKLSHKIDLKSEKRQNTNSLHIFSLSLPRDVNLQCQMKTSLDWTSPENCLKNANCWLVPGFNSLQKFKTNIPKTDVIPHESKCTCPTKSLTKRNSYNLQTLFGEILTAEPHIHQPDCALYKTLPKSPNYHNDNWVLHKSKINDNPLSAVTKDSHSQFLKSSLNTNSLIYLQPKSLANVCGGKHIVYLPGREAFTTLNEDSHNVMQSKPNKSTYKRQRQRQRQEMVRESLQDLTPIQSINQINACLPEKSTHRFSFQSTVRVLEKRRLADKLSKDAEVQEAQRLNELEAMKRVEEDFQRKRAPEKANLRNQLRLHLKTSAENEEYRSLPVNINDRYDNQTQQQLSDANNNIFYRAEPDGAVSPDFNDNLEKLRHSTFPLTYTKDSEVRRFESDGEESEMESHLQNVQCTALLVEPYLHSII